MKKIITMSGLVLASVLLLPISARAAVVYVDSSRADISVGDTVIVSTKINAEGVTINTVEGNVTLKSGADSVTVKEFSLANSSFGLWPRTPSLSQDGKSISFVGGVPGGFNIEGATLFKVILEAKKAGTVVIEPQNMIAYSNDGQGTKLPVTAKSVTIHINPAKAGVAAHDEWGALVSSDITPPERFIIVFGQDNTLFEGKKFAYFSALDNQSGISYYEVSENGKPAVRSGSTYVLQDQSGNSQLVVTAFDKAGNKRVATSAPLTENPISWTSVISAVIVILVLAFVFKKIRKGKKDAQIAQ